MQGNKRSIRSFRFRLIFFSPCIANEDHRLIIRYTASRMFMLEWVRCCCYTNLMQIDCIELEFRNQTEEFMPRNLLSSWPENVSQSEYAKTMPDANVHAVSIREYARNLLAELFTRSMISLLGHSHSIDICIGLIGIAFTAICVCVSISN